MALKWKDLIKMLGHLESAALNGHVEVVRELLKHGAEVESGDEDCWTPLESGV